VTLHFAILISYAGLLMGVGLWVGRRVRGTSAFFVAGRRLGPGLIFATLLAANIGSGSTVGAAALGFSDGLSAVWWVGSAGIGSIVLAFWVGPRIRAIAEQHDLRTVGDFLEYRYGGPVRAAVGALLWVATLAILAGQLVAISTVLTVVTGIGPWAGCVIGGVVVTVYFTAGGLLTSAWVNAVQLVVLLGGFALIVPMALDAAGGWTAVVEATPTRDGYWSVWRGGNSGWIYLAMLGPSFIVSPGLLQKIYGARDDRAVRLGVGGNALVLLLFAAIPPLLGMITRVTHPTLGDAQQALPTLMRDALPPSVGGLGLAALFSAEVSSADAALFMLSTSLSQDLYRRFVNPSATDGQVLRVARGAAVAGGVLGTALALALGSIVLSLSIFYTLLTVSLFVPVMCGLYVRRVKSPEALAAMGAGVGVVVAVQLATAGQGVAGMTPAMVGLAAAILASLLVMSVRRETIAVSS
jgi:SSS family solute:Na+ symporter